MRNRALQAALEDLDSYLASDKGQVVLFDATNTTEERRQMLVRGGQREGVCVGGAGGRSGDGCWCKGGSLRRRRLSSLYLGNP